MWRVLKWILGLAILLLVVVFIVLPLLANTEKGRQRLAKSLSRALDRDVEVGKLDVGLFFSSLDVGDLVVRNPKGFPEGELLRANDVAFDANYRQLLSGRVEGGLRARGITLHVIRKGGRTNLEGMGEGPEEAPPAEEPAPEEPRPEEPAPEGEPEKGPDIDVHVELLDSKVTIEDLDKNETLVLDGVSLEMRISSEAGVADSGLKIRVREIARNEITVSNLEVDAKQAGDWMELENLRADLPGEGKLTGTGRLRVKGGDDWTVELDARRVGVNEDMMPIVASLYPFAASAQGQVTGVLDAAFDVKGAGLTWEAMKPTLDGVGEVTLEGLGLPADSLIAQAAAMAGRGESGMQLNTAGAQFRIADGWLAFNRLSASGDEARYDLAGRVSLDGKLDLTMDLLPLVKQFGGEKYAKVAEHVKEIPLRIQGTTAKPEYRPPDLGKLAGGILEEEAKKAAGGLLDKLKPK